MKINESFLFFLEEGSLFAVDTLAQNYYSIDKAFFKRIGEHLFEENIVNNEQDDTLKTANFLTETPLTLSWGGDDLSKFFFLSTRTLSASLPPLSKEESLREYARISEEIESVPEKYKPTGKGIKLPDPNMDLLKEISLFHALQNRKTSRDFSRSAPLSIDKISALLFASFGYIHGKEWVEFKEKSFVQFGFRRSSPSIGSLQPCDAFIVVFNVDGLENGLFFYDMDEHSLIKINALFTDEDLYHSVCDQFWIEGLGAGIFITTDMQRIWPKYPDARSFAISYAEVGHFSQTVQLCATALEYHTWITGVFRDDFLTQKLNLPAHIFPAFFIGIGTGSDSSIPIDFL